MAMGCGGVDTGDRGAGGNEGGGLGCRYGEVLALLEARAGWTCVVTQECMFGCRF